MKNTLTKKLSILLASLFLISSFTSLHAFASDPPFPIDCRRAVTRRNTRTGASSLVTRSASSSTPHSSSSRNWFGWFRTVVSYMARFFRFVDNSLSPPPTPDILNETSENSTTTLQAVNDRMFNLIYPVGAIYMSVNGTNPETFFGGRWERWGNGRVPVGVNTSNPDFNSIERLGGSVSHVHTLNSAAAMIGSDWGLTNTLAFAARNVGDLSSTTYTLTAPNKGKAAQRSHNTALTGTTDNSENLQPYITCYMWKRVA